MNQGNPHTETGWQRIRVKVHCCDIEAIRRCYRALLCNDVLSQYQYEVRFPGFSRPNGRLVGGHRRLKTRVRQNR